MTTREARLEDTRSGGGRSTSNDEQLLVAQAKSGQSAAFGTLYESHRLKLYRSALRILRNRQDAEDAVQRAFQRAFTNLDGFREDSAFSTWVTRIAINEALMLLRQRRLTTHLPEAYNDNIVITAPDLADERPTPEQALADNELHTALRDAISRLRASLRSVVVLRELQGLTNAETAQRLGLTVSAVKARLLHAKRHLRSHLESTYKPSSRLMQRSERRDPCSQPPCFIGSRTPIRNIIVSAKACTDDDGLSTFLGTRARLFGIAHRILKSVAEAEDLVQDVWIRWQTTDRTTVRDAAAFLTTMTARLAINVVRSARSRRETSFGSSLKEPVDTCPDPQLEAERSEKLQSAVVVLLEKLSPIERAAYVLREAFDYSYREIANILRLEEANARQLVTRARQHVVDGQHSSANSAEQRSFLAAFLAAAQKGALTKFESFLVGSADGTVRKGKQPLRTSSTLAEPITVPHRHRWPLLPELDAKVA